MASTPPEVGAFWKTCATHTSLPMPSKATANTKHPTVNPEKTERKMRIVWTRRITTRSMFDGLDMVRLDSPRVVLFIICFLKEFFRAVDAGLDGGNREPFRGRDFILRLALD